MMLCYELYIVMHKPALSLLHICDDNICVAFVQWTLQVNCWWRKACTVGEGGRVVPVVLVVMAAAAGAAVGMAGGNLVYVGLGGMRGGVGQKYREVELKYVLFY